MMMMLAKMMAVCVMKMSIPLVVGEVSVSLWERTKMMVVVDCVKSTSFDGKNEMVLQQTAIMCHWITRSLLSMNDDDDDDCKYYYFLNLIDYPH